MRILITLFIFLISPGVQANETRPDGAEFFKNDYSPLSIDPISKYSCISRAIQQDHNGQTTVLSSIKNNYYFVEKFRPEPVRPSMSLALTCHDVIMYGSQDNVVLPRLEEISGAINLWSQDDHRMLNLRTQTSDGYGWSEAIDLEDLLIQKLANYGLSAEFNSHFGPLHFIYPETGNPYTLGWYLRSFVEPTNYLAVCPGEVQDAQGDYLQAVKDVIQVPTEAIYLAKRERVTYSSGGSDVGCTVDDFIFVTETEMRKAWFFYKNGVPVRPSNDYSGERQILKNKMHFYYPINSSNPTIRGASQFIYSVINPSEANSSTCKLMGSVPVLESYSGVVAPHDKRFGCIPKM